MIEIKKGMSSEFADSDATFPHNVFHDYKNKTSAEMVGLGTTHRAEEGLVMCS